MIEINPKMADFHFANISPDIVSIEHTSGKIQFFANQSEVLLQCHINVKIYSANDET